jgi:hypothetical protein
MNLPDQPIGYRVAMRRLSGEQTVPNWIHLDPLTLSLRPRRGDGAFPRESSSLVTA